MLSKPLAELNGQALVRWQAVSEKSCTKSSKLQSKHKVILSSMNRLCLKTFLLENALRHAQLVSRATLSGVIVRRGLPGKLLLEDLKRKSNHKIQLPNIKRWFSKTKQTLGRSSRAALVQNQNPWILSAGPLAQRSFFIEESSFRFLMKIHMLDNFMPTWVDRSKRVTKRVTKRL